MPTNAAERTLWTIWIGYFTTYFAIVVTTRLLTMRHVIQGVDIDSRYLHELLPYPYISMVSGLAFFIMGSNYWGRCYAIGILFFAAAPLMVLNFALSPLIFGVLWAIALMVLGLHLRKQGHKKELERSTAPLADSKADTMMYANVK